MLYHALCEIISSFKKQIFSREFNHKIKGIGHSSFTPDEVSMLKLPTSGNESVNARYLAKYDANASSSSTGGRYNDYSNRHNMRNVIASSTMKPPQNNSDLQHLRSWIQQKYIVKCWYVGDGGDDAGVGAGGGGGGGGGAGASELGRKKVMPAKVHRPTSSLSSLPKPTSAPSISGTLHSTAASHDDSFFDAIASSSTDATNKVDEWDAFGGPSSSGISSPAAFQANFGAFSEQQQQQQSQPPPQFQTATMVSLPPLATATGGSNVPTPTFQATFDQNNVTTVIPKTQAMQGNVGGGNFVADFSSMQQSQQSQMMQQQQQQPHPMQAQNNQGFASFPSMIPQQQQQQQPTMQTQQGVQPNQQMHLQSNFGHMQGGSGMMIQQQHQQQQVQGGGMEGEGWGGIRMSNQQGGGNLSEFPQQQSQPHLTSQPPQNDQSSFANFSSMQQPEQPISNEVATAAPFPPSNPNAFKAVDSDKMSAFDAFDGLSLEPTLTINAFGNADNTEVNSINASVPTGANEPNCHEGGQIANGTNEISIFSTDANVRKDNESKYSTMSIYGAGHAHPSPHPGGEMQILNNAQTTAVENSIGNGNDDGRAAAALFQETTYLLQKLNMQQLMQVHQLISSMTASSVNQQAASTDAWASHAPMHVGDVSTENLSRNGGAGMGMETMGEKANKSRDAANVPPAGAPPSLSSPPVAIAPSNALPPVEKEGNPFDF